MKKYEGNIRGIDIYALRKKLGYTAEAFWGRLGISSRQGYRYEKTNDAPYNVMTCVELIYVYGLSIEKLRKLRRTELLDIRDRVDQFLMSE